MMVKDRGLVVVVGGSGSGRGEELASGEEAGGVGEGVVDRGGWSKVEDHAGAVEHGGL